MSRLKPTILNVVEESGSISSRELSSSQDTSDVASTSSHSYNAAASCVQKYHETLRQLLVESENEEIADGGGGEQNSFNYASSSYESFSPTNKRLGEKLSHLTEDEFLPEVPSQEPEKSADDLGYRRLLITTRPNDNSSDGQSSTAHQKPSELPTGLIDYCLIFGK